VVVNWSLFLCKKGLIPDRRSQYCEVDLCQQHKDSSLQTKESSTANKGTVSTTQKGDAVNKKL
jgi:hypothetical protein